MHKFIDYSWWKDVTIATTGTIIGIVVTFGTTAWLEDKTRKEMADKTVIMTLHNLDSSMDNLSNLLGEMQSNDTLFHRVLSLMPDSPMKGGLVLFAAGNDNSNTPHFPINGQSFNRNRFITVGAVSSDKIRSSYSNYGWWVDVAAPGGEQNGVSIMSTALEGGYMLMNGTSMACPHVSGVAALIVSKFGSAGLTPEFVKNRILSTATPIEGYQAGYTHATETSLGIVNAYAALCDENKEVPGIPEDFSIKTYDKSYALFSWAMPSDSNGNAPSVCKIYTGKEDVPFAVVKTSGAEAGARYEYFDQSGYASDYSEFTIEAVDCDGNRSGRSAASAVADCTNDLAVINPYNIDNFVVYKPSEYDFAEPFDDVALTFFVNSDGPKTVEIENSNDFIRCSLFRNECEVTFDLTDETPMGTFPFTIKAYENSDPDNAVRLHLTCTVKNALSGNKGVVSTTGGSTLAVVETNKRRGEISMNLTKYLTHPWGTNFAIPDNSRTIKDDFFGFEVNYSIVNGILDAKYNFDNAITFCSASIKLDAVDEYMIESSFDVEVKFIDNDILYLGFRAFNIIEKIQRYRFLGDEDAKEIYDVYSEYMRQLLFNKNIKSIIVDVRSNSGGDLGDMLTVLSPLLKEDVHLFDSKTKIGLGRLDYGEWTPWNGKAVTKRQMEELLAWEEELPNTDCIGDRKVAFLIDCQSVSMAEMSATGAKSLPYATVIGDRSFGGLGPLTSDVHNSFCGQFGDEKLKSKSYYVYTSTWITRTADGEYPEGKGVEPDITVPLNIEMLTGQHIDNQLEYAIDYLHGKK